MFPKLICALAAPKSYPFFCDKAAARFAYTIAESGEISRHCTESLLSRLALAESVLTTFSILVRLSVLAVCAAEATESKKAAM